MLDRVRLEAAMKGHDVVYANLSGAMKEQSDLIVKSRSRRGWRAAGASA